MCNVYKYKGGVCKSWQTRRFTLLSQTLTQCSGHYTLRASHHQSPSPVLWPAVSFLIPRSRPRSFPSFSSQGPVHSVWQHMMSMWLFEMTLKVTFGFHSLFLSGNIIYHSFGAGFVVSMLVTRSDYIKHTWDGLRGQALLFIWRHNLYSLSWFWSNKVKLFVSTQSWRHIDVLPRLNWSPNLFCVPEAALGQQPALTLDKCARIFLFRIFSLSRNHPLSLQDCKTFSDLTQTLSWPFFHSHCI